MLRKIVLASVTAVSCVASAYAQPQDFAERVEHIVSYMVQKAEDCIGPELEGLPAFMACRGDASTTSLTIATDLPVRDGEGRIVETCHATLTATKVPGFSAVMMNPDLANCPGQVMASGEFARIFTRILLQLGDWIVRKEKPV